MPPRIDRHVEGTPIPFPSITADAYGKMAARYDRNPGDFTERTHIMMEEAHEGPLLEAIDDMYLEEKSDKRVLRDSLVMWRLLQEANPNLPPAVIDEKVRFQPQDPSVYRRENPHIMEGLRRIRMRPNGSIRVRAAMMVYQTKRTAFLHPPQAE